MIALLTLKILPFAYIYATTISTLTNIIIRSMHISAVLCKETFQGRTLNIICSVQSCYLLRTVEIIVNIVVFYDFHE